MKKQTSMVLPMINVQNDNESKTVAETTKVEDTTHDTFKPLYVVNNQFLKGLDDPSEVKLIPNHFKSLQMRYQKKFLHTSTDQKDTYRTPILINDATKEIIKYSQIEFS